MAIVPRTPVGYRVDDATLQGVEALAQMLGVSKTFVIEQAVKRMVEAYKIKLPEGKS